MALNYHGICFITLAPGDKMDHGIFCSFNLVKNHKIANNPATTHTRGKHEHIFGILIIFLSILQNFKNNEVLLNKMNN